MVPGAAGRLRPQARRCRSDVIVAIDQSGSMAESVVYAAVFGATLASIRSVRTSLVAFDTEVVDLTDLLADPVDVLFGCQLGGGTDINRAIAYCQRLISRPAETILVLISDLYEGGHRRARCCAGWPSCVRDGVTVIVAAGAVGLRRAGVRPRARRRSGRAGRPGLRLHAGSASPSCWRWRSAAATSPCGPLSRQRPSGAGAPSDGLSMAATP